MNLHATALLGLLMLPAFAADRPDMLRFTNGDQLRGRYDGVREGPVIHWLHDDLAAPAEFKTSSLHQLVLHEGKPPQPLRTLTYTELSNRDRFPGKIVALDDDKLTLETEYAGILHIPRDHISILAPNPMGGRIHYQGPYSEDEWKMLYAEQAEAEKATPSDDEDEAPTDEDAPQQWVFTGSSWLWKGGTPKGALTRASVLPERAVLRFDLSWKNRLSLAMAMHADFARPAPNDEDKPARVQRMFNTMDPVSLGRIFGNSHIIQFYSSYLSHVTTRLDEDGSISVARGMRGNQNLRMPESGRTSVELRTNRKTGEVALFIDDEFSAQWNMHDADEADKPAFTGAGIGFIAMSKDCPVRISDIVISEWNGMPDSARSLQVEDQDVVLMTNGTDRYAGKVGGLGEDGIVSFEGRHGSFRLPLEEIAEIRFARNGLAAIPEPNAPAILARMGPIGAINGSPTGGTRDSIQLVNPSVGKIDLSLKPVTVIDFNPSHISIDDWSHDF